MLAEPWFSMPSWVSLLVIAAILAVSTIASLIATNGRPGSSAR
jgi:hypothetical protein